MTIAATETFPAFASIPRLFRAVTITEKLDGTNALVSIDEDGTVRAGSRSRWITPGDDNFGFAWWVHENAEALRALGPGRHYGEWWGKGIQRGYGLDERRFSLFNVGRWHQAAPDDSRCIECSVCHVVPTLWTSDRFETSDVRDTLDRLAECGSVAAPGFMRPEGLVVFHDASRQLFKVTLDKNDGHKGGAQ